MDDYRINSLSELLLNGVVDAGILADHYGQLKRTGKYLVNKYGSKAAEGTDDYYHALAQCILGKMGDTDSKIGLFLGEAKEHTFDRVRNKESFGGHLSDEEFEKDIQNDLQKNEYGATMGRENRNNTIPCWMLLDHLRTKNMKN